MNMMPEGDSQAPKGLGLQGWHKGCKHPAAQRYKCFGLQRLYNFFESLSNF